MSENMTVKIGPQFFKKELREYRDWKWAYIREAAQNCIDAPNSDQLHFTIEQDGEDTKITFANNGSPMTEEDLIGKLLTMGETGKNFTDGATGGFGKAKLLLLFAHKSWSVRTGTIYAEGCGGNYALTRGLDYYNGTKTEVIISDVDRDQLCDSVKRFCEFTQWSGVVTLNGVELKTSFRKGSPRREFSWGKIYSNKSCENTVVVRINGIPMFARYTNYKGCIVVELTGNSAERLSSNRDSLLYAVGNELDAFLTDLSINKLSALRAQRAEYKRYVGQQIKAEAARPKAVAFVAPEIVPVWSLNSDEDSGYIESGVKVTVSNDQTVVSRENVNVGLGHEFIIRNTTGIMTPPFYMPDSEFFGDYSRKLIKFWSSIMLEMHLLFNKSDSFSIGFVFDEADIAMFERSSEYGKVYYISPAELVCQKSRPSCRSFRKRFALTDRDKLITLAAHEYVHGEGYSDHDEEYSSRFTHVMMTVMKERKRFNKCFVETNSMLVS